ncbi:MAG: glycogen/starch synthase [Desulfobacterales bacterium]
MGTYSPPRVLIVVPEALFFPREPNKSEIFVCEDRGRRIDFLGYLISDLYHSGVDVYLAQPDFRRLFSHTGDEGDACSTCSDIPGRRVLLTRDRDFFYVEDIDRNTHWQNLRISAAFQREVMYHPIPEIQPDLIHCFDWMTGLIPPAAMHLGIPCLFTISRLETARMPLWFFEDMGIDAAMFWENLFYDRLPRSYEDTRTDNPADLLFSGISAATHVNTISAVALSQLLTYMGGPNPSGLRRLIRRKFEWGWISCFSEDAINTQEFVDLYEMLLKRPVTSLS